MQVMSAVGAMQSAGHNKPHGTGSIVPALAKNARTGHPQFRNGMGKHGKQGHPPNHNQTISLNESQNGGPWKDSGTPSKGEAQDQISPDGPRTFNQHWSVDGKRVQLVVRKGSNGNVVKTWEVHVVINKTGDRPVYSAVP